MVVRGPGIAPREFDSSPMCTATESKRFGKTRQTSAHGWRISKLRVPMMYPRSEVCGVAQLW